MLSNFFAIFQILYFFFSFIICLILLLLDTLMTVEPINATTIAQGHKILIINNKVVTLTGPSK